MILVQSTTVRGPYIVTDGLVLYLDAANTKSYPGSGTVWTDLTNNKYTANKAGSQSPTYPLFNSSPGYFTFNGGLTGNPYGYFNVAKIFLAFRA